MAACFVCSVAIPKRQEVRKRVYTGSSVSGFNFSSIVLLNWLLNSALRKRPTGIRSYYALRTLCPRCAAAIDQAEAKKLKVLTLIAIAAVSIIIIAAIALLARQN